VGDGDFDCAVCCSDILSRIHRKDYLIEAEIDCDPEVESCFVWECDPESDVEGEACTGDPEMDVWYYKYLTRKASDIPMCDEAAWKEDEECDPMTCMGEEEYCEETVCTEEDIEAGESCTDPETFEYEEEECEEGDEECLAEEEGICDIDEEGECLDSEAEDSSEENDPIAEEDVLTDEAAATGDNLL